LRVAQIARSFQSNPIKMKSPTSVRKVTLMIATVRNTSLAEGGFMNASHLAKPRGVNHSGWQMFRFQTQAARDASGAGIRGGLRRSPLRVCAVKKKGGAFPVGASPTRQPLQPEATGAVMEVTKWLKPSGKRVTKYGDSASVQAVTRVNAEQASKRSMRGPIRLPYRGRLIPLNG
jgi:hypothetical protein